MANTITPSFYINAHPLITVDDLKVVLYKESDYPAEYASQTFAAPHPARTVTFPGIDKTNYRFKLLQMNGAIVVAEKASFDFVPAAGPELSYKSPMEIQADVTVGFASGEGVNSFTFDGAAGTDDWRGWEIYMERVGQGTMQRDVQYSWDKVNGIFTLLQDGDYFQPEELFNAEFGVIIGETAAGVPSPTTFTGSKLITNTDVLTAADAGKKIIIKGEATYFVVTLPDINTVASLKPYWIESGIGAHTCVRFLTAGGQKIDWMKGNRTDLKIRPCESLVLYREPATSIWRVHDAKGNFLTVGRIISSDADPDDEFNCGLFDGSDLSITEDARLYEDFVLNLPPAQVCTYADWPLGNNKYKWSLASGAVFKCPDRRDLYERNAGAVTIPGVFQADMIKQHTHVLGFKIGKSDDNESGVSTGYMRKTGSAGGSAYGDDTTTTNANGVVGDTETRPKSYITRKYFLR